MTDTATTEAPEATPEAPPAMGGMVNLDMLRASAEKISKLDEQIAAIGGSEAAMKKAVLTRIETDHADTIEAIFAQLHPSMEKLAPEVLVGVYSRFGGWMEESFSGQIEEIVDGRVKELADGSKGQLDPLKDARTAALKLFQAQALILEQCGIDVSSVPEPKRRSGGGGGRSGGGSGKPTEAKIGYNPERYRYAMNGKDRPLTQNSLSSLAFYSTMGCAGTSEAPERQGTAWLKDQLKEAGITWGKPGSGDNTWELKLPNDTVISARRLNPSADADIYAKLEDLKSGKSDDNGDDDNGDSNTEAAATA